MFPILVCFTRNTKVVELRKLEADYLSELKSVWPEVFRIYEKLNIGETLNTLDMN